MPVDQLKTTRSAAAQENVAEFDHFESDPSRPNRKNVAPGQLLISGTWRDSSDGATMASVDPTPEETITNVAKATAQDADAAENIMFRSVLICFALVIHSLVSPAQSQKAPVDVNVVPARPLIEHRGSVRFLNFDFLLKNNGTAELHLNRMQVSVYDKSGKLAWQRELDENGHPSGMSTVEERDIKPAGSIAIFNPFFQFDPELPLATMVYKFFFNAPGYETATPLDYQSYSEITVSPVDYPGKTDLILPIQQRSLIFDGHDFYAHHRRQSPSNPAFQKLGLRGNPVRYGYDFCPVNSDGQMYKDDNPYKKENWYAYGAAVVAPGAGVVVDAVNDTPENDYKEKSVVYASIPEDALNRVLGGNYVVLDHGNGEFSYFAHMRPGSVRVKKGDHVQQRQQIGEIGFAGDAFIPHLHYMLIDAPDILRAEGLPSYFRTFRRVLGTSLIEVQHGQIDSGDVVEPSGK